MIPVNQSEWILHVQGRRVGVGCRVHKFDFNKKATEKGMSERKKKMIMHVCMHTHPLNELSGILGRTL